ncbi:MAG: endonuclease/exonuclease/phosphatase family protein [Streptosporangiaceae bacterium]
MGLPRSPDSVLFTTYNVLDLFLSDEPGAVRRYERAVESIRGIDPDVLAVQEIRGSYKPKVEGRLRQLAADVGLQCLVRDKDGGHAQPALAMGSRGYHGGLLWRAGIEPVPDSFQVVGRLDFWHSLGCVTLDLGGRQVRHATFHAAPFGRSLRAEQNELLVARLTGSPASPPVLVGADWNTESADRIKDADGRWVLYEPGDPYAGATWSPDMIYQCEWDYDEDGNRRFRADRRPGDVLWAGGLYDAAAALRAPWQPTVGHYPGDRYGVAGIRRRIDAIRVSRHVLGALRAYHVVDSELTRRASDHLPVTVEYKPAAITTGLPGDLD